MTGGNERLYRSKPTIYYASGTVYLRKILLGPLYGPRSPCCLSSPAVTPKDRHGLEFLSRTGTCCDLDVPLDSNTSCLHYVWTTCAVPHPVPPRDSEDALVYFTVHARTCTCVHIYTPTCTRLVFTSYTSYTHHTRIRVYTHTRYTRTHPYTHTRYTRTRPYTQTHVRTCIHV